MFQIGPSRRGTVLAPTESAFDTPWLALHALLVVNLRAPLVLAVLALPSCRQPNPEWLGPVSAMMFASTSDGSDAGSEGATEAESSDTSTTADADTTTGPIACAPEPVPGDGPCPAACDSCEAGRCQITCTESTCKSQGVACPDGWPCDLACDGKEACKDAELLCPPERDCTVDCRGPEACKGAVVDCGSMPCAVTCGPQSDACKDLRVRCGWADTQVSCEGHSALSLEPRNPSCACEALDCA